MSDIPFIGSKILIVNGKPEIRVVHISDDDEYFVFDGLSANQYRVGLIKVLEHFGLTPLPSPPKE